MGYTPRYTSKTTSIANGASLSTEIDLEDYSFAAIHMPAAWTAANLTLQGAETTGGTFNDVFDDDGGEVIIQAAASRTIGIDTAALKIGALRYIKLRSGTTGTPVNQGAARTITVLLRR